MMTLRFAVAASALALAMPAMGSAATVAGFDSSSLPRCDDCYSDAQSLGFAANFFGTIYTDTYVSNNGYVTFGSGQGNYTPEGLGAGYTGRPIIAALFTDLDTREDPASPTSFGTGTFGGHAAFGVNYDNIGQYSNNYNLLDTFQILLVDRSDVALGDFDIVFNYDDVQFGRSASAGYNAAQSGADGTYYELPGSRSGEAFANDGDFSLTRNSNVGDPGRYVFNVRGGLVTPPSAVPEPATWASMIAGVGAIGGLSRRRRRTVRVTYA